MATPRLSTQQVAPTQRPNTLGVPRETQAAAVVGAAAQAADVFAREVQRIDDLRVSEAELDYRMRLRQAFDDPNDGLSTKRGTQAIEALDGFRSRVQNEVTKVESRLTSETQRALFRRRAATLAQEADLRAGQYVRGETLRVQKETYEANTALDMEAIAATPENADAIVRALDERTAIYADDIGMPPEAIALARAEARSKARLAQIQGLVSAGRPDAGEVFERVKGEMQTQDRADAKARVEQGDLIVQSQRRADDLFAAFGPNDERAALAEARSQFEGKLRDEVVRRLELRYADERRLRNEQVQQYSDQAMTAAYQGQPIPRDVETWLEANGQGRVLAAAQNVRLAQANGEPVQTNLAAYQELSDMLLPENRNAFLKVNLLAYADRVSASDLKGFINAQTALRGGSRSPSAGVSTATVMTETFNQAMASKMFDPERVRRLGDLEKYPEDKAIYETLRGAVETALQAERANQGTELAPSQVRGIIRQTLDGYIVEENDGGYFGFAFRSARPLTAAESLARREATGRRLGPPGMAPANQRLRQLRLQGIPLVSIEAQMRREGYTDADFEAAATLSRNP